MSDKINENKEQADTINIENNSADKTRKPIKEEVETWAKEKNNDYFNNPSEEKQEDFHSYFSEKYRNIDDYEPEQIYHENHNQLFEESGNQEEQTNSNINQNKPNNKSINEENEIAKNQQTGQENAINNDVEVNKQQGIKESEELETISKSNQFNDKEDIVGKIDINYNYYQFNKNNQYFEIKNLKQSVNNTLSRKEAIFENKQDGSKITIYKNRVAIDNTPENIKSAVDIAQDKGWTSIKISGGSRQAKAELWYQAQLRGIDTRGYRPTKQDMKRLLGAQQRMQENENNPQKIIEDLDIKPKEAVKDNASTKQEAKQNTQPEPKNEFNKEKQITDDEKIKIHLNEVMGEYRKFAPWNEKEFKQVEESVHKMLIAISSQGNEKLDEFVKNMKKAMPVAREELAKTNKKAQKESIKNQSKTNKETTKNKEKEIGGR